jgi:glutathionylspermidine synthase
MFKVLNKDSIKYVQHINKEAESNIDTIMIMYGKDFDELRIVIDCINNENKNALELLELENVTVFEEKDNVDMDALSPTHLQHLQRLIDFHKGTPMKIREALIKLCDLGVLTLFKNNESHGNKKTLELDVNELSDSICSVLLSMMVPTGFAKIIDAIKEMVRLNIRFLIQSSVLISSVCKVFYEVDNHVIMFAFKLAKLDSQSSQVTAELSSSSFSINTPVCSLDKYSIIAEYMEKSLPSNLTEKITMRKELYSRLIGD